MRARKTTLGAACAAGIALALLAAPAFADYGPSVDDVVGVGSDTVQNVQNFLDDGDILGDSGYNGAGNKNRVVSFDATADANDGAVYANGGTIPNPVGVVLRAGTSPWQRPNGSGAGLNALKADIAAGKHVIDFVRGSSQPSATDVTANNLHVVKIATDDLVMSGKTGGNAVAVSPQDLVAIYECTKTLWTQVGGTSATTIKPYYPDPLNSGTGKTFKADLDTIKGSSVTYGSCAHQAEENDPTLIKADSDAYAPMSEGRKKLFDSGYFHNVTTAANGSGAALSSGITLLYGSNTAQACTAPTGTSTTTYCRTRGLYITFRDSDSTSTKKFQPGGTNNWVKELFLNASDPSSVWVNTPSGQSLIQAGGADPNYRDCLAGASMIPNC